MNRNVSEIIIRITHAANTKLNGSVCGALSSTGRLQLSKILLFGTFVISVHKSVTVVPASPAFLTGLWRWGYPILNLMQTLVSFIIRAE